MLKEDSEILLIPVNDASSNQQAAQLGAPLEASKGMYLSLQHKYLVNPPSNKRDTIYEAIEQYTSQSQSEELMKPPLTPQTSFSMASPPVPSKPIPTSKKPVFRTESQTPFLESTMMKTPLTPQASLTKAPPLPSTPIPGTSKQSISQILSTASQQPTYGNVEEIYDDIEEMMLTSPLEINPNKQPDPYGDDIYEDIADPSDSSQRNIIPAVTHYEVPTDAQEGSKDPFDMDYEEV